MIEDDGSGAAHSGSLPPPTEKTKRKDPVEKKEKTWRQQGSIVPQA